MASDAPNNPAGRARAQQLRQRIQQHEQDIDQTTPERLPGESDLQYVQRRERALKKDKADQRPPQAG